MDNRDEDLMALLEAEVQLDDLSLIRLIGILSTRSLGPDTIEGTPFITFRMDDRRAIALLERRRKAARRALELIRASHWYGKNHWPTPLDPLVTRMFPENTFRTWIDHCLQQMDAVAAIKAEGSPIEHDC